MQKLLSYLQKEISENIKRKIAKMGQYTQLTSRVMFSKFYVRKVNAVMEPLMNPHHLTSPAPWKTITFSESFFLLIRRLAISPATATAAVP